MSIIHDVVVTISSGSGAEPISWEITETIPDVLAPSLVLLRPRNGSSCVRLDSQVLLEVWDSGDGLDASTVVIKINGLVAWEGDAQQTGFSVDKTVFSGGIRYLITPDSDFNPSAPVDVEVAADDLATNSMLERRTFHTGAWV